MNFEQHLRLKRLQPHYTYPLLVCHMLASAERSLADSALADISDENRIELAYKCIMKCCLLGLMAHGCVPAVPEVDPDQTAIESLSTTMQVEDKIWLGLYRVMKERRNSYFSNEWINPFTMQDCTDIAQHLMAHTLQWFRDHQPKMVERYVECDKWIF